MEAANQVDPEAMDAAQRDMEKKRFPQRYPEAMDAAQRDLDPKAMDPVQRDLERQKIVKNACIAAEAKFSKHPGDAESLKQWARALLHLSQFGHVNESKKMLEDAISKLHAALTINPTMHEAMWCLGEAHSCQAFRTPDHDEAQSQFDQAFQYFKKACPRNEKYRQSLRYSAKTEPEAYKAMYKDDEGTAMNKKFECVILAVGFVAWIVMTKMKIRKFS